MEGREEERTEGQGEGGGVREDGEEAEERGGGGSGEGMEGVSK